LPLLWRATDPHAAFPPAVRCASFRTCTPRSACCRCPCCSRPGVVAAPGRELQMMKTKPLPSVLSASVDSHYCRCVASSRGSGLGEFILKGFGIRSLGLYVQGHHREEMGGWLRNVTSKSQLVCPPPCTTRRRPCTLHPTSYIICTGGMYAAQGC